MRIILFVLLLVVATTLQAQNPSAIGLFDEQGDVGNPIRQGNVSYRAATGEYLMEGAGSNMWKGIDQFHFLWKKIKGDFIITATVKFIGEGVACLLYTSPSPRD